MASSGKQLNVKMNFQIDTTQAQQQLKGLYSQLNQITSASAFGKNSQLGITQEIMQATKAAAQLKTAITEAVNPLTGNLDLTKFNDQLRMSGMSLNQYREQLASLGTTGNQAFNQLTRSIATAETPLLRTSKAAQTMWTVLGNTVRWQATSSLLHGILSTASQAMGYVRALDSSLNNIRIVTGQSQEQMARFAKTANQAAKELNTSTNEYAKASLIYYQQGLSNKQVEERTRTTIKLANVAGQSAKTVSDQMTAVWNNFYNGSKSIEYYADVITALGASTASSSEEIAKGLQKFSSIAETTGLSYEYATSALATVVATTRQSADSVGTSFKTLFSRLQSLNLGETLDDGTTLNKYSQALNTVGVSIKKANGDLRDMDDILADLGSKWQSLGKDQQIALAQTVGGVRNYTGLVALMDNWDKFQTNLKTAQTAQGTLQAQADIYAESWQAASAHVKAASETIYKNLLDDRFFKGLTNGFGSILDIIGSVTNSLGGFGGTMTGIVALASRMFAPQLTNAFSNIGFTIQGRSKAIEMQEKAIASLKEPTTVSQYSAVNNLQNKINNDLYQTITEQRKAIDTGKMPTYMQAGYNTLMNFVDQQGVAALQATERAQMINTQREFQTTMDQARLNAAGNGRESIYRQNASDALKDFARYQASPNATPQERARRLTEVNFWQEMAGGAMPLIRNEEAQARALQLQMYGSQTISQAFGGQEIFNGGKLNEAQMKMAIGFTQRAIAGAGSQAELAKVYGKENAAALYAFNKEIEALGPNAKYTGENLDKLNTHLFNTGGVIDVVTSQLDENNGIATSYANLMERIEKRVAAQYGEQTGGERTSAYMSNLEARLGMGIREEYEKIAATGGQAEAQKFILQKLKELNGGVATITGAEAAVTMTQAFAGVGTAVISGVNAIKTLGDESATAGQKASALVTAMGTMPMAISSATKVAKDWSTEIGNSGITMGGATAATLGLTLAITGLVVGIKQMQLSSTAAAAKTLTQQTAVATQAVSDAQTSYDNLLSGRETHNNLLTKLQDLEKGTQAFSLALVNANEAARNLIDQYDLIYGEDYNYGQNGEIIINQASLNQKEEEAIEKVESTARQKALNTYAATLVSLKEDAKDVEDYSEEVNTLLKTEIDATYQNTAEQLTHFDNEGNLSYDFDKNGLPIFKSIQDSLTLEQILEDYANNYQAFSGFKDFLERGGENTSRTSSDYYKMSDAQKQQFEETLTSYFNGSLDNIDQLMASGYDQADKNLRDKLLAPYTENPEAAIDTELRERREAAARGMIETAGQAMDIQDDLTKFAIKYMESDPKFAEQQEAIAKAMYNAETTTLVETAGKLLGLQWGKAGDLELLYKTLFETQVVPEDLKKDQDQLKFQVATKFGEYLNLNGLSEDIIAWIGDDALASLKDFQGLNQIREQLENNEILQGLSNYSRSNISSIYSQIEELSQYFNDEENGDFYKNIALTLSDEISRTQGNLLQTLSTYSKESPESIQSIFQDLIGKYDLTQLETITTYLTQVGSVFGEKTFKNLTTTLSKTPNQKTLENLSKINWDDTFSALNDVNKLAKNLGGEKNLYSEILTNAIEDLGAEGGIFQKLYNSSGFQDVLQSLTEQFDTMGAITTDYVEKFATKNEDLSAVLGLGRSGYTGLNINSAGLAMLFNAINSGQIKSSQVTSGLLSSLSTAGALEAEKANAFNIVDNQDFGRSGTDLLDYFINGQKTYMNAKTQNLTFDTPLRNFFEHMMPTSVRDAYYQANMAGNGKTFDQIMNSPEIPQAVKDFLNNTNRKGNKTANTWEDIIDLYGGFINEGVLPENWLNDTNLTASQKEALGDNPTLTDYMREVFGLEFKNGNINLFDVDGSGKYKYSTKQTTENLTKIFSQIMGEEDAKNMASVWTAYIGESSAGTSLLQQDAYEAVKELKNQQPNIPGGNRIYNEKTLETAWSQYGSFLSEQYGTGDTGYKAFKADILSNGGLLAPQLNSDFWQQGITKETTDLIGAAFGQENNLGLSDAEAFDKFLEQYGAKTEKGRIDLDKFTQAIEFIGGSENQINDILDKNQDLFNNIDTIFTDRFGNEHTIRRQGNETAEKYEARVNRERNAADSEWFSYIDKDGKTKTVHDPLGYLREHYIPSDKEGEAGTWKEGYNPDLTPQSIAVNGEGQVYGLSQTGEVIVQGTDGNWYRKTDVDSGIIDPENPPSGQTSKSIPKPEDNTSAAMAKAAGEAAIDAAEKAAQKRAEEQAKRDAKAAIEYQEAQKILHMVHPQEEDILAWEEDKRLADEIAASGLTYEEYQKTQQYKELQAQADAAQKLVEQVQNNPSSSMAGSVGQLTKAAQEAQLNADLYQYQNLMTADQRFAAIDAARELYAKDQDAITPFQKMLLQSIGEIEDNVSTQTDLAEEAAEESGGLGKRKQTYIDEETGQIVDENKNPISMPSSNKQVNNGTGQNVTPGKEKGIIKAKRDTSGNISFFNQTGQEIVVTPDGQQIIIEEDNASSNNTEASGTFKEALAKAVQKFSASGQNNNLLTFASGKEGQIAVTGELGPELRIKEDGSADLLGKKGREYAWVNPGDRIYTASQTASILGSNNIPVLEGLAKGIRNYIPGYSGALQIASTDNGPSSGGSGGSGGGEEKEKDPRYDPNTLKIRDILERYYTILQQLNVIAHAVEHISKVVDRGWGQERIKAIQEQTALYRKQYDAQVKYVQEIRSYTKTDKEALTTMVREFVEGYNKGKGETDHLTWNGAEFDENGVLTNYKDFVEKLVEQYNKKAEENAGNKEAQYKFQEQLKDIQFYTESLNLLMTEEEKLYDLRNQILDNQVQEISYRIEYENELDNNDLRLINYELSKVKDNAYEAAEAIALIGQTSDFTEKSLARYEQGIWDILKVYSNPETVESMQKVFFDDPQVFFTEWSKYENNFNFQDITTEHAQLLEQYMDTMVSDLQKLQDNFEQTIDFMGDNIKEFSKTLDKEVGEFDYFADIQKNLKSILDLTNRRQTNVDSMFLAGLNADVLDNAINKMKGTKRTLETMTQSLKEANTVYQQFLDMQAADTGEDVEYTAWLQRMVDRTKKNLDTVNEQYEKANKDWLQSWEDALSKIEESYKQAVEEAGKAFEESFSPFFTTLDLLQAQFDREKKLQDLFVDDYQRIHDLSKLNRDIEQSMLDTDNLRSKSRLRDLQKEINQLQADGTELSEYDLDILDKKYKLELARQALEDAKDAKSLVRLSRDNNGNWGYVYTSNEDEVAKAEQDYEDAIREMEEANENYIANIQDQIIQVQQEAQQAIQNLQPQDFETYEDYLAAVQNIQDSMMTTLNYLRAQLNGAFANQDYLDPFIVARYGENNHNLTNDFGDLILSKLLDTNTMDQVVNDAIDRFNKLSEASEQAFTEYSERQREVWQTAGHDIADAAGAVGEMFKEIADQSNEQVEIVEQVADRIDEAYSKTTNAIKDQITNLQELTDHYETFLEKVTEFLRLSGEYIPGAKKDFYETIDSWEEIAEIEKELAEKKDLFVTDLDASGNQRGYHLYEGNAETNTQIAAWKDSLMRGEAIGVGDAVDTRDELNQINSYLDAHGEAYVNINGELIHLVKGTEETNRLLAEWLAYIEYLERPKQTNNGSYGGEYIERNNSNSYNNWLLEPTLGYPNRPNSKVPASFLVQPGKTAPSYKLTYGSLISDPLGLTRLLTLKSGGYIGRWQSALSGMYTGEWPMGSVESNGRWALLHQKELVLNAHDTENFLDAMEIVRQLDNLTNWMANGLGSLFVPNVTTEREQLEQNVHIDASFPNVQDHKEIEMAFDNIVNLASQYANRK